MMGMPKKLLAILCMAFMLRTATCTARGRQMFQLGTTSADGADSGGESSGMGFGLLDGLDAASLGWDDFTFGQATGQLNQWITDVQSSALTALQDRPLASALLSEGGAAQEGGLLSMLGLGGAGLGGSLGGGSMLQQMAQSVQDAGSSGGAGGQSGGILGGGGLLGGGSQLLGGDSSLVERLRSAFGTSDDGLLQQLMSGNGAAGTWTSMFQNAGHTSNDNKAEGAERQQGSLASRYYNKAGN